MKEKVKTLVWTKRLNNKDWMQKAIVEVVGDGIMLALAIVIGYYIKTIFI
jgi:hypothetical protein